MPFTSADPDRDPFGGPTQPSFAVFYALTVVGFPLASTLPVLLRLDSQAASVPFRVLLLLLFLWLLGDALVRRRRVYAGVALLPVLALWWLLIARMLQGTLFDPLPGEPGMPVSQYLLLSLGACFLPALGFLAAPNAATLELARRLIESLGTVAMLLLVYLAFGALAEGRLFQRLSTEVLNPISVGHLGASVFIVTLFGLAASRGMARLLRWAVIGLAVVVTVASLSRAPILSAVLLALVYAFTQRQRGRLGAGRVAVRLGLLVGAGALCAMALVYIETQTPLQLTSRFVEVGADASSRERELLFAGAWDQFMRDPLLGDAYIERRFRSYPHNIILESMMATGIVGLTLLLLVVLLACVAATRLVLGSHAVAWVGFLYFQNLIAQMFSGALLLDGRFWAFTLAVLALAAALRRQRRAADGAPAALPAAGVR
jgi:O-antigen ligase